MIFSTISFYYECCKSGRKRKSGVGGNFKSGRLPLIPWHLLCRHTCPYCLWTSFSLILLGDAFMVKYYPDVLSEIAANPPDISPDDEKKLALEASSWLKSQLLKAAKQVTGITVYISWAQNNEGIFYQ